MKKTEFTATPKLDSSTRPHNLDVIPEPTHPTKTTRVFNWLAIGSLVVIAVVLGILLRWSLADSNVLQVKNAPFPVRTIRQHAESGGVVILNVDICKITDVSGSVRTSFVSSTREVFLPVSQEHIPKGCLTQEIPIVVPKDLPPDTYKIKFRATYNLNPLKKGIVSEFESKSFEIDPSLPTTP